MVIAHIQRAIELGRLRISEHAIEEMVADKLMLESVVGTIENGEVIEEYPTDHPLPSCLVLGFIGEDELVHAVCAYNDNTDRAVLVTGYRPDPDRWINWRVRKAKK